MLSSKGARRTDPPAQGAPTGARGELLAANNALRHRPVWLLLLVVLTVVGVLLLYQRPLTATVNVGTPGDQAYVRNFHTRLLEGDRAYRWSDVYGYVAFPGLGGGRPFTLTVQIDPGRTAPVTLIANGETLFSGQLREGWQMLTFAVGGERARAVASRDTVVEVRAPDYRSPDAPSEPRGVKLGTVRVEQSAVGGFIQPPLTGLLLAAVSVVLFYLLAYRLVVGYASRTAISGWAVGAAAAGGGGLLAWTAFSRVGYSAAAGHVAVTAASAWLLLIVAEHGLQGRFRLSAGQTRSVAALFALGFALRYGGMALPQSVIIDMPWHMKWLRTLLAGDWQSLYFPGGLSSVPREWGMDLLIPKSPLFYFATAPLAVLPFDLETSVKWLISCIDAGVILLVPLFLARMGGGGLASVAGSALYAFMPLDFRAFAYGILPTILAQFLAAMSLALALAAFDRPRDARFWLLLTASFSLAILSFPTVALFLSLVVGAFAALHTRRAQGEIRRTAPRIVLALAAAWALAVAAYYGLYISPVLASAQALLAPRASQQTVRWPGGIPDLLAWTADYIVSVLPAILAGAGLILYLVKAGRRARESRGFMLLVLWLAIAPLFVIANWRVDMIGKHLFFAMLPVAVFGGVAAAQLFRRAGWGAMLALLVCATVAWQALDFWIERLVRAST